MKLYEEFKAKDVGEIKAYISNRKYVDIAQIIKELVDEIKEAKEELNIVSASKNSFINEMRAKQTEIDFAKDTIKDIIGRL